MACSSALGTSTTRRIVACPLVVPAAVALNLAGATLFATALAPDTRHPFPQQQRVNAAAFEQQPSTDPAATSSKPSKQWRRLRSANFTIVGNASEKELRFAALELERFREALLTLFPSLRLDSPVPTITVLFKDDRALSPFKPRDERGRPQGNVGGYFSAQPDVNLIVLAGQADRSLTFQVVFHEYAHYVVHRTMQRVPTWLSEGLAEFYSTFRTDGPGRGIIGTVPVWRAQTLRAEHLLPLEDLLTVEGTAKAFKDVRQRAIYYAEAWALVHYLSLDDRRRGQLVAYLRALDKGRSIEDAFREAFGVTFDQMENELDSYLHRLRLPGLLLPPPEGTERLTSATTEFMTEADAEQLQGDLLMRLGADAEAERHLAKGLDLDSAHPAARVSFALVRRHQDRHDEAIATLKTVAEQSPASFSASYWLANTLADAHRHEEASLAYGRALALNNQSPHAWFGLSLTALALDRRSQAEAAFTNVLRLDSSPTWYRARASGAFALGKYDSIVRDVQAYHREAGWGDESSPYMAFLAALAYWRLGQSAEADALLTQAAAVVAADSWQAVVSQFMQGRLAAEAFLDRARDDGEKTEAHAYIGLKAAIAGRRDEALQHLKWVRDRGNRNYIEYGFALAELERLEHPTSAGEAPVRP